MKTFGEHAGQAGVRRDGSDMLLHSETAQLYVAENKTVLVCVEQVRESATFSKCTYKLRITFGKASFWLYDVHCETLRKFAAHLNEFVDAECTLMAAKEKALYMPSTLVVSGSGSGNGNEVVTKTKRYEKAK